MKRRSRKARVRWLPDQSYLIQTTRHTFVSTDSASLTYQAEIPLLPDDVDTPEDLSPQVAAMGISRARQSPGNETLILDHIQGKFCWSFDGAGLGGSTDAGGLWQFVTRLAIGITPRVTEISGGASTAQILTPAGAGATQMVLQKLIDPGNPIQVVNAGSQTPDGVRILWRRSFMFVATCGSGFMSPGPSSDTYFNTPLSMVDIKPHRILKPTEALTAAIMVQAIPFTGADGACGVTWGQDLRVAAHNTYRRR